MPAVVATSGDGCDSDGWADWLNDGADWQIDDRSVLKAIDGDRTCRQLAIEHAAGGRPRQKGNICMFIFGL